MMKIVPYVVVPNAKKAITGYEKIFGATVVSHMPFTPEMGSQMGLSEDFDYDNSTMHAEFDIGGSRIYISDNTRAEEYKTPGVVEILLELDSKEEIEKIYNNAKENGLTISNELEKTFWGAFYARFVDLDGIGWQLNYQIPE